MFKEYKINAGMSYSDIGNRMGVSRETAKKYILTPGNFSLLKMISVGLVIGMPAEIVRSEWKKERIKVVNSRVEKEINETI